MDSPPRSPPAPPRSPSPMQTESPPSKRRVEEDAAPVKRARTAASKTEDRARGKRLFGNLMGTLRKFQDDDKSSRTSEAAKRREQTASRIADKLRAEHAAIDDLQTAERELRTLRVAVDNAVYVLEHKEIAITSRHATLRASQPYLSTSTTPRPSTSLYPLPPAPISLPPTKSKTLPPLYFRPKVLTPSQEETLSTRNSEIDKLISEEEESLSKEREEVHLASVGNRDKLLELEGRVRKLRSDLGDRAPRREAREEEDRFVVRDGDDMEVEY